MRAFLEARNAEEGGVRVFQRNALRVFQMVYSQTGMDIAYIPVEVLAKDRLYQPGEKRFFDAESVKYRKFFVVKSARYIVPIHGKVARFEFFTGQLWEPYKTPIFLWGEVFG